MESAQRVQFLREYGAVRHAEGRGSDDPAYYLALPYRDLSGQNDQQWQIRGRSFRYLERVILPPLERRAERPLDILDLGAGNCWMSYRLALRKHRPVALDIFSDQRDGLGAVRHYPVPFPALAAQFDQLPFRPAAFDLAIFNASVHYSTDLHGTLRQSMECLRPGGRIIIVDSPVYARPEHGERMKAERLERFEKLYGFRSDALHSREYLDRPLLDQLSRDLGIRWHVHRVWYGWRWWVRPIKARLQNRRPPSQFWILEGELHQS
jgi:SAM-dependent methyltransferase